MAVTDSSSTAPTSSVIAEPAATRGSTAASAAAPAFTTSATPKEGEKTPVASAPATFGLTVHFDPESNRLILEARDPISGFIVFQAPPQYIVKPFSANGDNVTGQARGDTIDKAV